MKRSQLALGLAVACSAALQACAPQAPAPAASAAANGPPTVAAVISSDARFSNLARVVQSAGLWSALENANGMTVFAPTNEAFDRSAPNWRVNLIPDQTSTGNAAGFARQRLIKSAVVAGIHPPQEFAGHVQSVTDINGTAFQADGRTPGVIVIRSGPVPAPSMGVRVAQPRTANASLPPIDASNGLIYPVDAIIGR